MYIYFKGAPDPPAITSLSLEGNSLRSSWDYVRIPTIDVTLCWSLPFFRPSQLSNMTTTLLNTNTYNYNLQGVRSCDPFRLCIRAENEVGNSSCSWINNTLPYLPQREDIKYSLLQVNETFSLNVTVMVKTKVLHYYHFKSNASFHCNRYIKNVNLSPIVLKWPVQKEVKWLCLIVIDLRIDLYIYV